MSGEGLTRSPHPWVAVRPVESMTRSVTVDLPASRGRPAISPVVFRLRPAEVHHCAKDVGWGSAVDIEQLLVVGDSSVWKWARCPG